MARPKGSKDKKLRDPEVQRQNARRARGRWANTEERRSLEQAKEQLRAAISGGGADRLAEIIRDRRTPPELFLAAFRLAGDRCGLPPEARQEVTVAGREVVVARGPIGWLERGDASPSGLLEAPGGGLRDAESMEAAIAPPAGAGGAPEPTLAPAPARPAVRVLPLRLVAKEGPEAPEPAGTGPPPSPAQGQPAAKDGGEPPAMVPEAPRPPAAAPGPPAAAPESPGAWLRIVRDLNDDEAVNRWFLTDSDND